MGAKKVKDKENTYRWEEKHRQRQIVPRDVIYEEVLNIKEKAP